MTYFDWWALFVSCQANVSAAEGLVVILLTVRLVNVQLGDHPMQLRCALYTLV